MNEPLFDHNNFVGERKKEEEPEKEKNEVERESSILSFFFPPVRCPGDILS